MKKYVYQFIACTLFVSLMFSCQQQNKAVEAQELSPEARKENYKGQSDERTSIYDSKSPRKQDMVKGREGSLTSNVPIKPAKKFWSSRQIFYRDLTGDSSSEVYDAIKGQRYFDNTYIFVYATLEDQEGTSEYEKIAETLAATKLDDRIFIWVHLTTDKKVKFIRKLISDNIRDSIDQGTKVL